MENENTNGTVIAVETNTETAVKANKKAVIPARKVKAGKCGHSVGAPLKEIIGLSNNRRRGLFSKKDIFESNGQTISSLCITQRIARMIKAKELFKAVEKAKSTGSGRPAELFTFDATKAEAKSKKGGKGKKVVQTVVETPVTETQAAPAEIQTVVEAPVVNAAPTPEPAL